MEFNGQNVEDFKLFGDIDISSLPENLDDTPLNKSTKFSITQANITADIPNRFAFTTLSDVDSELAEKIRPFCLSDNDNVFLLFGNVGMGKTTSMSAAIHERAMNEKEPGLYFSIRFLLPTLRNCRSFSAKENELQFYKRLSSVPFLCLDEVGTCFTPSEEREFLTTVLSARFDNKLPTMIATNLPPYDFKYLITGRDGKSLSPEEQKKLCHQLDVENPVLNRIKSVAITHKLIGESYRTRG